MPRPRSVLARSSMKPKAKKPATAASGQRGASGWKTTPMTMARARIGPPTRGSRLLVRVAKATWLDWGLDSRERKRGNRGEGDGGEGRGEHERYQHEGQDEHDCHGQLSRLGYVELDLGRPSGSTGRV